MANSKHDSTPRERLARLVSIFLRTRFYWRSSALLAMLGVGVSLVLAHQSKREWKSETTVLYRSGVQAGKDAESPAAIATRLGPKLEEMLSSRGRLSEVVQEFNLFPEKQGRSMLDATEEVQSHLGFRARTLDTFVISFVYDDPRIARDVTAKLAELLISDYNRDNPDAATLNRDFLQRELERADKEVEATSRALSVFLAKNPPFQWGNDESPDAPQMIAPLAVQRPAPQPNEPAPIEIAQKQRDTALVGVTAARAALAEKVLAVTAAHPDAVAAKAKLEAAEESLAAAEQGLAAAEANLVPKRPSEDATAYPAHDGSISAERRAELQKERASQSRVEGRNAELSAGAAPLASAVAPRDPNAKAAPDVVELETDWHRLRVDLERARERLHTAQVNARAAELSAATAEKNGHAEMTILDPAYLPTRPDKGRERVFFVGAALSLLFTFAVAGTRVLLDDRLYDRGDIDALGAPEFLVAFPRVVIESPAPRTIVRAGGDDLEPPPIVRAIVAPPVEARPPSSPPALTRPALPRRRHRTATMRFGIDADRALAEEVELDDALGPSPAVVAHHQRDVAESAAMVLRRMHRDVLPVRADTEVEEIGAHADPETDEVLELLRRSPAQALAALRVLRHRLEQRRAEGDGRLVISVLSAGEREGKTTLATRLAMILAEADRARVALVEANLERPGVATSLGLRLPERAGFSNQIHRRMIGRLEAWGVVKLCPSLAVLAEPGTEAEFPAALHSSHFDTALKALRRSYDYVVIDGPSVLGTGIATVVESASDGVILVARSGATTASALRRAALEIGPRRIVGVVLNDVGAEKRVERGA